VKTYLGIDVGSVSANFVLVDEAGEVLEAVYLRTRGRPLEVVQEGVAALAKTADHGAVAGVGTTGSGRVLAGLVVGADVVRNEITAHAAATARLIPGARTILEIGGQDSKLIIISPGGTVADFAMNTVCAAGTGSFLDQQAARLGIPIEEFGAIALEAQTPVRIAGRCAVFAETDMIHKQAMGYGLPEILAGLCEALVRNYLNNLGKGKDIRDKVVFQGGVAANAGMRRAFERVLKRAVHVPPHHGVMGALGAALLARAQTGPGARTGFKGFDLANRDYRTGCFNCNGCANQCEVVEITQASTVLARWGDRCGRWSRAPLVSGA
jgi:predicted CoA-substrate-specific enzyme activase